MKKIISIILALMIICVAAVPTFAATLDNNTPNGEALVVYQSGEVTDDNGTSDDPSDDTVVGTFTVTIPEYISVAAKGATPTEYDVVAKDVLIPFGTSLTVKVSFDKLSLGSVSLGYEMKANPQKAGSLTKITSGSTILTVAAGNPTAVTTSTIGAVLTEAPLYSGIYTDTAVFEVTVG